MARRQDGVSAPEPRAGRMATSARMTLGQESWPAMRKAITAALEGDLIRGSRRARPSGVRRRISTPAGSTRAITGIIVRATRLRERGCARRFELSRARILEPSWNLCWTITAKGAEGAPRKNSEYNWLLGGRTRARTWDPLIKSQLLYQLSYAPGPGPERAFARRRRLAKRLRNV
jgi:hypothetical protein